MKAIRLRTCDLKNPIGLSGENVRLSWNCDGGCTQTAYQIEAHDVDSNALMWDSGKVSSSQMAYIPWRGKPLNSRAHILWTVQLWDEQDQPGERSEVASFELALSASDWRAQWITGDYVPRRRANQVLQYLQKPRCRYPVDCFCKEITLPDRIRKARIYASACGLYELSLDGKKLGNWCLAPGITDYRKRVQLQTLDVTADFISAGVGRHSLTLWLADGWYRGSVGAWGLLDQYGTETKAIAQLELTYTDGSTEIICTDNTWRWSCDGPLSFADNKDGEHFDARRQPSYRGQAKVTGHAVLPTPGNNVPITEHETFTPQVSRTPSGKVLLDMGQNFAGYISFSLKASGGERLSLRFGEMLKNGDVSLDNIQLKLKDRVTPAQRIDYICKPGDNRYRTRFAIFGYQYVELDGDAALLNAALCGDAIFTGIAVYSDLERVGWFNSSNPLLDRLVEATVWSTKSNSADLPTDCPTRERHGWTGDAQIFFNSAAYLFDYRAFSRKYLNDMYDWQRRNGNLPQIVPDGGADFFMGTMNGSSGWSDAGIMIPYRYAAIYQDEEVLRTYYPGMLRFAHFMQRRCGHWSPIHAKAHVTGENRRYLVNCGPSYGEWAEPADVFVNTWKEQVIPHPEVSTAYASYMFGLMADIAARLGYDKDATIMRTYREGCKTAYQELVSTQEYSLDTDRQACLVRPLYMGLLNEEQTGFAHRRLIEAMEHYGWRLGTGFLSTPFILDVLASIDPEAAYRLLENEEQPGWLCMPRLGASTIWESWEGPESKAGGIGSLNHYSKGAVVEWLFSRMCGIRIVGENRFSIAPLPGGRFAHARAEYVSIYGRVFSGWKRQDGKTVYTIDIPSNTTALLTLPGSADRILTAGHYEFEVNCHA